MLDVIEDVPKEAYWDLAVAAIVYRRLDFIGGIEDEELTLFGSLESIPVHLFNSSRNTSDARDAFQYYLATTAFAVVAVAERAGKASPGITGRYQLLFDADDGTALIRDGDCDLVWLGLNGRIVFA